MKKRLFLALLAAPQAFAANTYFRPQGDTSVVLRRACAYELDGVERLATLDFDTASLSIIITASGDGADTTFTYTGGNIDDYDGTPPAWGNPTTSAIEVEAAGDCVNLHIRDEVFAVSGATEWTVEFTDGGTAILDQELTVLHIENAAGVATAVETALGDGSGFTAVASATAVADVDAAVGVVQATLGTPTDLGGGQDISSNLSDMAGATFNTSDDSQEAIRNRGDSAWVTGAGGTGLTAFADGTAQAGAASTITLASAESFADNVLGGTCVNVLSGTGAGQSRVIISNVGSTDVATVAPAWTVNPASDSTYEVVNCSINMAAFNGAAVSGSLLDGQDVGRELRTTVATVNSSTEVELTTGAPNDDAYGAGYTVCFWDEGDDDQDCSEVTDYATSDFTLTYAAVDGMTVEVGDVVRIFKPEFATVSGTIDSNLVSISGDPTAAVNLESYTDGTTPMPVRVTSFALNIGVTVAEGECDSGSTTTCVDSDLTQDDDYWKGTAIVFTDGTLAGQSSCVYDFTADDDTLIFRARTVAADTHAYKLVVAPTCEGVVAPP